MNKILALIPVVFAIFALMISPAVMSVSADTDNNGRENGKKTANGCDPDKKGKAANEGHNPNCVTETSPCDPDGDGNIFASELAAYLGIPVGDEFTPNTAEYIIHVAELAADHIHSQTITEEELPFLNAELIALSYPTC